MVDLQPESQMTNTTPPSFDFQLINVNVTSSSPPDTTELTYQPKKPILRANSARTGVRSSLLTSGGRSNNNNDNDNSRKLSSTVIQFEESTIIKRPNSTIGLPTSMMTPALVTSFSDENRTRPLTTIETPESSSDISFEAAFNPGIREKASSLTLPDSKLQCFRKGSSNPFLNTDNENKNQQKINHHNNHQQNNNHNRTSIILNGNILHSISPIPPGRPPAPSASHHQQLSIYDNGGSFRRPRGSIMSTTLTATNSSNHLHRPSYIGEEEHRFLQQQYLSTGRKDTIISIGKNFQIQFKNPSTKGLAWRYRSGLEKFLIIMLLATITILFAYIYLPKIWRWQGDGEVPVCTSMECVKTAASLLNAMDLNADPCEDFFQFACGNWIKKHIIPEDRSSLDTFEVLAENLRIILKDLLEQPPNSADNSATLKAKRFYKSCMDTQKIDAIGVEPILETLNEVGGWPVLDQEWKEKRIKKVTISILDQSEKSSSKKSSDPSSNGDDNDDNNNNNIKKSYDPYMDLTLENLLGKLRGDYNLPIIVEQYVGPDDRNSSHNIIQFDQASLGLPSRDNFLKEKPNKEKDAYLELMVDIAELLGAEREYAMIEMTKALELETELANASMPEADRHDTSAIYNKKSIKKLQESVPEFDWMAYLKSFMPVPVDSNDDVVIYAVDYYKKMGKILDRVARQDKKIIINLAVWRLMKNILPFLDGEFGVKRAKFRKVLLGISADRPPWTQCVELVNKKMGMAVGALFIRDHFDPKSKEIATEMIHNIRQAFIELLDINDWMDEETRLVAKEKANAINERIGYPELLTNPFELSKEYSFLELDEDEYLLNVLNIFRFEAYKNLMKLGTEVDKDSWTTDPAVVNAFYSPNKNDIVFPAGILQPLFYSHYFPKSLNYGGIGVVIGHEITHGFDDRGRQFDKDGNMAQWWNNATIKKFRERAQCIIDQYSSYVLEDINANVNGRMTKDENIADNGGLKQSYRAFKKWEKINGVEPLLPGMNFTHDQLFFLNYAQIWCGSMRPEDALNKIRSSVHSPGPIRVLGPLSNSYDFSNAYSCTPGSRMNPAKKCSVW